MQSHLSPKFQSFLFQAELARVQNARLKRIARDFDLLVQGAAIHLEGASLNVEEGTCYLFLPDNELRHFPRDLCGTVTGASA